MRIRGLDFRGFGLNCGFRGFDCIVMVELGGIDWMQRCSNTLDAQRGRRIWGISGYICFELDYAVSYRNERNQEP